jgi:hypothetical protein
MRVADPANHGHFFCSILGRFSRGSGGDAKKAFPHAGGDSDLHGIKDAVCEYSQSCDWLLHQMPQSVR